MRRKIFKIALLAIASVGLISCEEFLDQSPDSSLSEEQVYSDYTTFQEAVDYAYDLVINPFNFQKSSNPPLELGGGICDEGTCIQSSNGMVTAVYSGSWISTTNRDFGITTTYRPGTHACLAIRACNLAIKNADLLVTYPGQTDLFGVTTEENKVLLKEYLLGECYFLRAFHYFQFILRYGGMPEMREVFTVLTDFDVERPSYIESTEWLVEDLDTAIELLPDSWTSSQTGDILYKVRATKTSAKALKAMALLYSASPTMCGTNTYGSYDQTQLAKAYTASVEAIKAFEESQSNNYYIMYDWDNYSENFYSITMNGVNSEAIFQPPVSSKQRYGVKMGAGWTLPAFDGGWEALFIPTQNAVDRFTTASGYRLDSKEARDYAEGIGEYDSQDPYANRDPRLAYSIYCHGALYNHDNSKLNNSSLSAASNEAYVDSKLYMDGRIGCTYDGLLTSTTYSGYLHKKFRYANNCTSGGSASNVISYSHIRAAQLYLDFAEISNELYGPTGKGSGSYSAVDAINVVRRRVTGLSDVPSLYTSSTATFREYIYNERSVELYCEGHRWHDIRRWRLIETIFSNQTACLYGANITGTFAEPVFGEPILLTTATTSQRLYAERNYWYPFPTSTINMFHVFEQNPGW